MSKENLEKKALKGYGIPKNHKSPLPPEYYEEILKEHYKCGINAYDFRQHGDKGKRAILTKCCPNTKLAPEPEKLAAQYLHIIDSAKKYIKLKKPIKTAEKCIAEEKGLSGDALYGAQEKTSMVLSDLPLKALRILSLRYGRESMGGFYRE